MANNRAYYVIFIENFVILAYDICFQKFNKNTTFSTSEAVKYVEHFIFC